MLLGTLTDAVIIVATYTLSFVHSQNVISPNAGNIYLENGQYNGILVAVDQRVEFHENIIPNLRTYFTQASEALYQATQPVSPRRFRDVTILLPRSWPRLQQCQGVSTENQIAANFIVEADTEQWESNPHTLKMDPQCGAPGKHTFLPRSFVVDENEARKYGDNIGKTIIHEWGHLRWGLYDELEEVTDPVTCELFDNGVMHPYKCSTEIEGDFYRSEDGTKCSFQAHLEQEEHVKGSLMYLPYIKTVTTFCNKTGAGITHNSGIPNPQNDRCSGKSAWEVLMEHADFKEHKDAAPATAPDVYFQCVQEIDVDRMVLVMDVSGSMLEEHRLERMRQDVSAFLKSLPCRDTSIGMVQFSGTLEQATILHPMAQLNSGDTLETLKAAIPQETIEHTCIGCGLKVAMELVENSGMSTKGTVFAVFTDGMENMAPSISNVATEVSEKGIVVYSILLMSQATNHPLIQLSKATGGKACTFSDSQHTTYYDCLSGILHHRSPLTAPSQILSEIITVPIRERYTGQVTIDTNLVEYAEFVFTWSSENLAGCEDTHISLMSPTNQYIDENNQDIYDYNYNLRSVTIDVSAFLSGKWTFTLTNTDHFEECVIRVMVEARQLFDDCSSGGVSDISSENQLPLLIFPTIDNQKVVVEEDKNPLDNAVRLYTEVRYGPYAVVDAQVEADIQSEDGRHWKVKLYDNGTGADAVANDGVYSRYFTRYDKDGTYTATFNVVGTNDTRVLVKSDKLRKTAAPVLPEYRNADSGPKYQPIEQFQRTSVAGFFEVVNYDKNSKNETEGITTWFPPPQIVDLRILSINNKMNTVSLKWTAVGNTLDHGTASSYEIGIAVSADDLRSKFNESYLLTNNDITFGDLKQVKDVGESENFIIQPNDAIVHKNRLYFLAVRTINSYGKISPVSNVVRFQFSQEDTTTSITNIKSTTSAPLNIVSTNGQETTQKTVYTTAVAEENTDDAFPMWIYWIIAGLGGGFLLALLFLCMVCCTKYPGNGNKRQDTESQTPQTFIGPEGMTANPDGIQLEIDGNISDQEPDLIKEIHEKDIKEASKYGSHSTWPAANKYNARKKKDRKKKSANIFRSIGRSQFITGIKKKLTSGRSSEELDKQWNSRPSGSVVPLQDHPYSNPLFGHAVMVPEINVQNTVIVQESQLPSPMHNTEEKF